MIRIEGLSSQKSESYYCVSIKHALLSMYWLESAAIAKGEELMFGSVVAEFFDELIGRTKDVLR